MSRSKSPARTASVVARSAAKVDALNEPHVQAAIGVAFLAAAIHHSYLNNKDGKSVDPTTGSWADFFSNTETAAPVHEGFWNYGWLFTFHVLNIAQSAEGGYWLNSLINTFMSVFACDLVRETFFGKGITNAISVTCNESNIAIVSLLWFFCNNELTAHAWNSVKTSPIGGALDLVLSSSTIAVVAGAAAGAFGDPVAKNESLTNVFGYFSMAMPILRATVVGSAANFFPLNKGFHFEDGLDEAAERAFVSATFAALAGFFGITVLDSVAGTVCGNADATVTNTSFIVFLNVVAHLVYGLCPAMSGPLEQIQDKIFELTNLSRE